MYRFFVPTEQIGEDKVWIEGDDVNHIKNVLRMQKGEKFLVTDGRGSDYLVTIDSLEDNHIECDLLEQRPVETELPVKITLFQALPKKDKMELIIQKSVELGAYEIVPVNTKRCVVKLNEPRKAEKKIARWQSIAESAAKQSGRGVIPNVSNAISFSEALKRAKEMDFAIIPYELWDSMEGSMEAIKKAAKSESVGIFIGPEGGFERGELEQAIAEGVLPISLGKRILRTETAGLCVLSVMMFQIEANLETE